MSQLLENLDEALLLKTIEEQLPDSEEALGRCFDGNFKLKMGDVLTTTRTSLKTTLDSPGLVLLMLVGDEAFLLAIENRNQVLPEWCLNPDTTGISKLTTLCQELGMTMVPEGEMPMHFPYAYVDSISEACQLLGLASSARCLNLQVRSDRHESAAHLMWPVSKPMALTEPEIYEQSSAEPEEEEPAQSVVPPREIEIETDLENLPAYTRSLLRIEIPMTVKIVSARRPIGKLLDIGPGSILQFEKNCELPLVLEANNETIAEGTAVRVGDRYGLQITQIVMPRERFWTVQPQN